MAKYEEPISGLGSRIMKFRKTNKLTQADLAQRYDVSGPAIFKFEKGFVTPSLKIWQRISSDIGIPEKEAVLLWVKEKLPPRLQDMICERSMFDTGPLLESLKAMQKEPNGAKKMRDEIMGNPEVSPALKKFIGDNDMYGIVKPTAEELVFLVELDRAVPLLTVDQFRDAIVVGRSIEQPGD